MTTGNKALDWFPKLTGPGDMDAAGGRRLLGSNTLSVTELLLRETAQNSWDARLDGLIVDFGVRVRRLDVAASQVLREVVLPGPPSEVGIVLPDDETDVLEIFDRGTAGLGGPVRNDLEVTPGEARNFIDFVLNLGAPRDSELGGGTYGFGKTAAYVASDVGTIVIWTRTADHGRLQHRLIASAMSDHFVHEGRAHTGRHWWGRKTADARIEPVLDDEAADLGSRLFGRKFVGDETGTSLLIIQPSRDVTGDHRIADRFVDAIQTHLWPKLIPGQPNDRRMLISVAAHNRLKPTALPPPFEPYVGCLEAVRHEQTGGTEGALSPLVHVVPIRWRGRSIQGHLALTKYRPAEHESTPANAVCLMRHDAELVVKYLALPGLDDPSLRWAGVFKPVADYDDGFAQAEPPAHDDWIVETRGGQSHVRTALRQIRAAVAEYLKPSAPPVQPGEGQWTAGLGDALADLAGPTEGGRPIPRTHRVGGSTNRGVRPGVVEVVASRDVWHGEYRQIRVEVHVAPRTRVQVEPRIGVVTEGAIDRDQAPIGILGWHLDGADSRSAAQIFERPTHATLILDAPSGIAVDLTFNVTEVAG